MQTIFGILGGIGADQENLVHMKRIADKLFGEDYYWSVLAAGRHQLGFVTMSAIMGGNIRVGLEDSLYAGKGRLAKSNAEQVRIVRSIIENLSLAVASPDEGARDARAQGRRRGRVLDSRGSAGPAPCCRVAAPPVRQAVLSSAGRPRAGDETGGRAQAPSEGAHLVEDVVVEPGTE